MTTVVCGTEDSPSERGKIFKLRLNGGDIILSNGGSFLGLLRQKGTKKCPTFIK